MVRVTVTIVAVAAVACLLSTASCSSPSKDLSQHQPSPSALSTTRPLSQPTLETSLERRARLDQEAALVTYRSALAESDRLFMAGGSKKPSNQLTAVADGPYLRFISGQLRLVKKAGWRGSKGTTIVYAAPQGWAESVIHVKACEDVSKSRLLDNRGRDVTPPGHRRYVQDYTVKKQSGKWKLFDVSSQAVASFDQSQCSR